MVFFLLVLPNKLKANWAYAISLYIHFRMIENFDDKIYLFCKGFLFFFWKGKKTHNSLRSTEGYM